LVRNNLTNQKANSLDPDQTDGMCRLIWISTVRPRNKGVSMEEGLRNDTGCTRVKMRIYQGMG
jgi:hypothetical protein